MNVPKPAPPKKLPEIKEELTEEAKQIQERQKEQLKKPFVRPEHLTQRAFRDNPGLQELKQKLEKDKPVKRNPRRSTQTRKTQEKK
jgi:hypothetical protein